MRWKYKNNSILLLQFLTRKLRVYLHRLSHFQHWDLSAHAQLQINTWLKETQSDMNAFVMEGRGYDFQNIAQ